MFRLQTTAEGGGGVNRAILSGAVGQYGVKLTYTETAKPQTSFTLVCTEAGKDGASYWTFIPVLIIGTQAEDLAATLEPGDPVLLEGKLTYKAGKTKDAGKLVVTCFSVEVLARHVSAQAELLDRASTNLRGGWRCRWRPSYGDAHRPHQREWGLRCLLCSAMLRFVERPWQGG